mmetsp:Transcript_80463/g.162973  ORF Transcript_80463/g.162973 Transcript_80463/m.162973 type:complete len:225 (-) Transcript_80463:344-1018(-)|eukprot:CAMPEP_0201118974 /NCGR_PEP_ID=MMETSP0850-20130426/3157_1 /ASSEMBLY_ACC=CAM_ASM_000622 /TAXON_ID=183588 /ORGANISM="Pseudo-nitzschia fraudulenta, Strain WWA7" /LENGTH=224 /DNA_ID=CAMNT_0047384493 /DNA_START=209 /DNA_END=883 /DNA_ORIENTATION=+
MGGAKRMSAEEKRKVILGIYHKDQQVYTEKEILSLAAKAGISANSIPDIHQGVIDDALVEKAKIGGSNYFWSFRAKKDRMAQIQHGKTLELIEEIKPKVAEAEARLSDAKRGREEDDEEDGDEDKGCKSAPSGGGRAKKLARLTQLGKEKAALEKELEKLKENDPAALADLEKELRFVTQAAHRWTDNIFECKSYLVKKRGMQKKEACKFLQISSEFDYPEEKH